VANNVLSQAKIGSIKQNMKKKQSGWRNDNSDVSRVNNDNQRAVSISKTKDIEK